MKVHRPQRRGRNAESPTPATAATPDQLTLAPRQSANARGCDRGSAPFAGLLGHDPVDHRLPCRACARAHGHHDECAPMSSLSDARARTHVHPTPHSARQARRVGRERQSGLAFDIAISVAVASAQRLRFNSLALDAAAPSNRLCPSTRTKNPIHCLLGPGKFEAALPNTLRQRPRQCETIGKT